MISQVARFAASRHPRRPRQKRATPSRIPPARERQTLDGPRFLQRDEHGSRSPGPFLGQQPKFLEAVVGRGLDSVECQAGQGDRWRRSNDLGTWKDPPQIAGS